MMLAWAVYPLLPSLAPNSLDITPVPVPQPPTPSAPRSKSQHKKKDAKAKASVSTQNDVPPTPPAPKKVARQDLSRLLLLPCLPFLTSTVLRSPTLVGRPSALPYRHPSHPLRILSSVQSQYSGIVVVGEAMGDSPSGVPESVPLMRYLRAGHSLLGGNWMGEDVIKRGPLAIQRETGEMLGDSIYNAFVLQEAIRLVERSQRDESEQENALVMCADVLWGSYAITDSFAVASELAPRRLP